MCVAPQIPPPIYIPEGSGGKLVEDGRVTGGVVVVAVALGAHAQVVPVQRVQSDNSEITSRCFCVSFIFS